MSIPDLKLLMLPKLITLLQVSCIIIFKSSILNSHFFYFVLGSVKETTSGANKKIFSVNRRVASNGKFSS